MSKLSSGNCLVRPALLLVMAAAHLSIATGDAGAQETLRVGRAIANSWSFVPLDVGMAAGIFARHGLAIESVSFTGSARLQQGMAARSIDIGLSSGPELAMVAKGAPVIAVGAIVLSPRMTITVGAKGPIRRAEDLRGKRIGVSTSASLTEWLTRELSRREGWGREGIQAVALGSDAAQIAAMETDQIDGLVLDIATALRLENSGAASSCISAISSKTSSRTPPMRAATWSPPIRTASGAFSPAGTRPSRTCALIGTRASGSRCRSSICLPTSPRAAMSNGWKPIRATANSIPWPSDCSPSPSSTWASFPTSPT
jgi:ABC-type amino acid transport substrate-binding protein